MNERYWLIKQADNFLYYADLRPDRVWTTDPFMAVPYRSEEVAINAIIEQLGGRGQAVEFIIAAPVSPLPSSAVRGPYGPPKFPYGPGDRPTS